MYYVHILLSEKDKKLYIGYSSNLRKRIESHLKGQIEITKNRLPLILVGLTRLRKIYKKLVNYEIIGIKAGFTAKK